MERINLSKSILSALQAKLDPYAINSCLWKTQVLDKRKLIINSFDLRKNDDVKSNIPSHQEESHHGRVVG